MIESKMPSKKEIEVERPELISVLGMLFRDKILEHDLSDNEIFFLIAKLLTLFITVVEKQEGKIEAEIAFSMFMDMFHANKEAAVKVVEKNIGG